MLSLLAMAAVASCFSKEQCGHPNHPSTAAKMLLTSGQMVKSSLNGSNNHQPVWDCLGLTIAHRGFNPPTEYEEKHQNPSFLFEFIPMAFAFITQIVSLSPGKCSDFCCHFHFTIFLFLKVIPEIFVLKGICSAIISLFGLSLVFLVHGYF